MVVTFAWKIDNNLYAYIVNNTYLDSSGEIIDGYSSSDNEFKGVIYNRRLSEVEEKKIFLYCKNTWANHGANELASYTSCFNNMVDKVHNHEFPAYFYVSFLDVETYFFVDEECDVKKDQCCVYTPDGDDVTACNKQGDYEIRTQFNIGGIAKGTPLSELAGKSFSEILNIILFGDKCGLISPPDDIPIVPPVIESISVNPNTLNVPYMATDTITITPTVLNVTHTNNITTDNIHLDVAGN